MKETTLYKQLVMEAQFGQYLALVQQVPYSFIAEQKIVLSFDFNFIDDEIAFYMVAQGYLEALNNQRQILTLMNKGNAYRRHHRVAVEREDDFINQVWQNYVEIETMPSVKSEIKTDWQRFMTQSMPELAWKLEQWRETQQF